MMKSGTCPLLPPLYCIISADRIGAAVGPRGTLSHPAERLASGSASSGADPICSPNALVLFSECALEKRVKKQTNKKCLWFPISPSECVLTQRWHHVGSDQAVDWPAVLRKALGIGLSISLFAVLADSRLSRPPPPSKQACRLPPDKRAVCE